MKSSTASAKKNPARDIPKDIQMRINRLYGLCKKTMASEQYGFRRRINRLRQSRKVTDRFLTDLKKLTDTMQAAAERRQQRIIQRPEPSYNDELPIVERKKEIIESIQNHQVTIISGETGSGKTTQIPKFCLEAGRGVDGLIGCTQPRRIAAITVAARIAEELGEEPGRSVGYKIRFQDHTADTTFIKLMTDGILLAETQGDRWLNQYDTLIVDEAHERSLNIDFVLGILKTLVKKRRDLKLIITSATIDTEKFSKAFDNAPVIEVSGRMYPVDVRYMDFGERSGGGRENGDDKSEQTHVDLAVRAVEKLHQESPYGGDVLVFMPTEQDIRETCELLEGRKFTGVTVMPLFGRLSAADQGRVFRGISGRKVIVATNVAETSLTIPGIKYVVDTGLARISQYLPRSRTTALPVIPVSRSSADQRKGRCGRVENGVCIRLYSEEDYENRPRFTPPEILRSNLAEVILRMISLKLGDINEFPFIDRPAEKNIRDGFKLLEELGAIHRKTGRNGQSYFVLTGPGRQMARLPIDPRLSRMMLEAAGPGCLEEITVVAAALSIQDPRERPAEKKNLADKAHQVFKHPQSDFLTLLNIWKQYHQTRAVLKSIRKMRAYCKEHFLAFKRMREWRDIHYQLKMILKEQGIADQTERPHDLEDNKRPFTPLYEAVHRAVLSGFLSNIAEKKEKFFYRAAKEREVMLFPGSGLFETGGKWVVASEMVETSRLFARTVANVDVEWIEPVAGDQCKRIYLEPHWERKKGNVIAYEQVTLYGLVIVPRRPVLFGRIDAEAASKIFIQSALVEGDMRQSFPFMQHNRQLIDHVRALEDKVRRRDLLVSETDLFDFYETRLPNDIYDIRSLKSFLKSRKSDDFLRIKEADLYRQSPDKEELSMYPDRVSLGNHVFPCNYNFEPGKEEDGVTVKIASALAPSVPSESMEWLVPGLLEEKITILIKGLPKEFRKKLVPVNQTVETILKDMPVRREASLLSEMSAFIYKRFGVDVPASAWDESALPEHLKMRISIRGSGGREIQAGRDVSLLSKTPGETVDPGGFEEAKKAWERSGIKEWDFGDLPETVPLKGKNGEIWTAYPGLKTAENDLMLTLFKERAAALSAHRKGVRRLFGLRFAPDFKYLKKQVALPPNMKEPARYFGGAKQVESRMVNRIQTDLFLKNIRTREDFHACAAESGPMISIRARTLFDGVCQVMNVYHECRSSLFSLENSSRNQPNVIRFLSELRDALANLVPENFVDLYDLDRFAHLQRYIRAVAIRAERGVVSPEKDQAKWKEVQVQKEHLSVLLKELSPNVSDEKRQAVEDFFWMIEEFKVSLFAQELKTPVKVSAKRLEKQFGKIRRMI